jgi:hypothetical protein
MKILSNHFNWGPGGYKDGPSHHTGKGWKRENAWDLETLPGTDVYSITDGRVVAIQSPETKDGHLFGSSFVIIGKDNFPDVFYCNMSGLKIREGEKVFVGQKLGKVAKAPHQKQEYLHIAVPFGISLSSLVGPDGTILMKTSDEKAAAAAIASSKVKDDEYSKSKNDKTTTSSPDSDLATNIVNKVYGGLGKVLLPVSAVSGIGAIAEEIKRFKELIK